jgi:hypothetical protein
MPHGKVDCGGTDKLDSSTEVIPRDLVGRRYDILRIEYWQ